MQMLIQLTSGRGLSVCLSNKLPDDVDTLGPQSNSDLKPGGVQCSLLTIKFRDEPFRAALEILPCHQGPRFLLRYCFPILGMFYNLRVSSSPKMAAASTTVREKRKQQGQMGT